MSVVDTQTGLAGARRFSGLGGDGINAPLGIAYFFSQVTGDATAGTIRLVVDLDGYVYVPLTATGGLFAQSVQRFDILDDAGVIIYSDSVESSPAAAAGIRTPVAFNPRLFALVSGSQIRIGTANPGATDSLEATLTCAVFRNDAPSLGVMTSVAQFLT